MSERQTLSTGSDIAAPSERPEPPIPRFAARHGNTAQITSAVVAAIALIFVAYQVWSIRANARVATAFGLTGHSFPDVALRAVEDGLFAGHTPYLRDALKSGRYDRAFFLEQPLYPDQMVFLVGTFDVGPGRPEAGSCRADPKTGIVLYRMPEASARTVEETLTAVLFIAENAKRCGFTLSGMGESAKRFIANWESEKYRKSLGK